MPVCLAQSWKGPISVTGLVSSPGSVITANSTVFPFLLAGNAYWLVVTAPTADTCATWYSTTSDTSTNLFSNTNDSPAPPWTAVATGSQRPAFEIDGDPASGDRTPFQVHYVTHVNSGGDSFIDITNDGQSVVSYGMLEGLQLGGAEANLCIGVYFFDATEELQACCACEVTPNGLVSLSVRANYATNLNQSPDSEVVKLLSWAVTSTPSSSPNPSPAQPTPSASVCNAASPGVLISGMHAWATTLHPLPSSSTAFTATETPFSPANLSIGELNHMSTSCGFNQIVGSGIYGQCLGCQSGGLGAAASQ